MKIMAGIDDNFEGEARPARWAKVAAHDNPQGQGRCDSATAFTGQSMLLFVGLLWHAVRAYSM